MELFTKISPVFFGREKLEREVEEMGGGEGMKKREEVGAVEKGEEGEFLYPLSLSALLRFSSLTLSWCPSPSPSPSPSPFVSSFFGGSGMGGGGGGGWGRSTLLVCSSSSLPSPFPENVRSCLSKVFISFFLFPLPSF